jgi:hypothetical protein
VATGDLLDKYENVTVEMHRSFGEVIRHSGIEDRFIWWRDKYSRPLVAQFDSNIINEIFRRHHNAVIIFNMEDSDSFI